MHEFYKFNGLQLAFITLMASLDGNERHDLQISRVTGLHRDTGIITLQDVK